VTGRVTLDGKPLSHGSVTFVPDASKGTTGPLGSGAIGQDGRYQLRTVGQNGALVGWHKIRVMAIDRTKPGKPWIIPIDYGHPDKSGLTAEVRPNQDNEVNLVLKSRR